VVWPPCHRKTSHFIAGLITIYMILFLLMSSCFFRIVLASPGYVPRIRDDPEKNAPQRPDPTVTADIFVCESGGYPRWCRTCEVIKPDRAHHSRDAGRCVYKMGILWFLEHCLFERSFLSLGRRNDRIYPL
jgi:hypothetical protein